MKDQVLHLYKTTDKITVYYITISMFLDRRTEDERFCLNWKLASVTPNLLCSY